MRKIWISFLILSSISILISGCINDESSEKNSAISVHEGEVILTIWLDEYNFTEIAKDFTLHMKIRNIGNDTVKYDDRIDVWIKVELTFPNGSSRMISEWSNITYKPSYEYLEPGDSFEWSRGIIHENLHLDYFDPDEFGQKGTYSIQAMSGDIKSNIVEIRIT